MRRHVPPAPEPRSGEDQIYAGESSHARTGRRLVRTTMQRSDSF
jgi:hypothetical protein